MVDQVLISRDDLAKRWGVDYRTICNYETNGIITRNPNIPTPRYSIEEILKLEGVSLNQLSPLEKRKLERELETLRKENDELKGVISTIFAASAKIIKL